MNTSALVGDLVPLVDLNPLHWLGDAAKEGVADGFTAMMISLWSAALWLLQAVFTMLDRFTTPTLDNAGLSHLYAVTLWISLFVALVIALGQIGLAAIRRDGSSLGTVAVGVVQYGAVVTGWLAVCGALVMACGGLTTGLLQVLLDVDTFSGYAAGDGWVDQVSGSVEAAVLGLCALFMLIPASFGYILIMVVREAALLVLTATMPIAAAGALGEGTRAWMWKSIRWFLAACLTSPLLALILGLGVQISRAAFPDTQHTASRQITTGHLASGHVVTGQLASSTVSDSAANIGTAVVGCVIMLVACFCPMVLFRLLAFVDPGTGSGASLRSTMNANGGVAGLVSGKGSGDRGSGAAIQIAPDGRTASEGAADAETSHRFSAKSAGAVPAVGRMLGGAMTKVGSIAQQGASMGVDVMGQSGVGHQGYYDSTPASPRGVSQGNQPHRTRVGHGWDSHQGVAHDLQPSFHVPPELEGAAEDGAFLA